MGDKDRDGAIDALIQSQLATVDVMRQTQATMQEVASQVGRLCDRLDDFVTQSDSRHQESERNIRVLDTRVSNVERRLKSVEEAAQGRAGSASR